MDIGSKSNYHFLIPSAVRFERGFLSKLLGKGFFFFGSTSLLEYAVIELVKKIKKVS